MQKLKLTELTVEDVKRKTKTTRPGYATELAKVIRSQQCDAGLHDIYTCVEIVSFLRGACVPRICVKNALSFNYFPTFFN